MWDLRKVRAILPHEKYPLRSRSSKANSEQLDYIRVDDNFYRVCNIAKSVPELHGWIYLDYVYYVIIRPIPRAIWKDKPIDPGYAITLMSEGGTLLSCTILGELWMSMGFWALALGGWMLGKAARLNYLFFYSKTGSLAPLFYGYMTMWLFVGYRSLLEIVLFTYPLISWMAIVLADAPPTQSCPIRSQFLRCIAKGRGVLWLVNQFVPPDLAPTARLLGELSQGLRDRGWKIRFLGRSAGYRTGLGDRPETLDA